MWLMAVAIVAAAAPMPAPRAAEPVVVKLATIAPKSSVWHSILQEMGDAWQKSSKGAVVLRIYPGGVAGDDSDVVRKLRLGTLNAAFLATGMIDINRDLIALQIPMAYASYEEFDCVVEQMLPAIDAGYSEKGFVLLGLTDGGFVQFFTKTPMRTPDDLKGMKLFVWAGDDLYVELWKRAGFNPVPLPATEISTALQTGLVNVVTTTPQASVLLQWFLHVKYMTRLNWAILVGGLVVSRKTWDKIPAELRPALLDAAHAAARRLRDVSRRSSPQDIEAMKKRGLNVVEIDPAALDAWKRLIEGVYPKVRGAFIPAKAFDTALELRDACRQKMVKTSAP
jgi:TRAP-type C4-dicarboxylate transport system substrate-binding protein